MTAKVFISARDQNGCNSLSLGLRGCHLFPHTAVRLEDMRRTSQKTVENPQSLSYTIYAVVAIKHNKQIDKYINTRTNTQHRQILP